MKDISPFFNPLEWYRALRFRRRNAICNKSSYDHELYLYSTMLKSRMLHFGYFDDPSIKPESISIEMVEDMQRRYARLIIEQLSVDSGPVLDVGCGLGGLAEMIAARGLEVEMLTPDRNQIEFIVKHYPGIKSHSCRYEDFVPNRQYNTIINSESFQYIKLDDAFRKSSEVLTSIGKWIITDFFRLHDCGASKSYCMLDDFRGMIDKYNWRIIRELDITPNILPTLELAYMYMERFLFPLKHYGYEKLRYKHPCIYYLSGRLRGSLDRKLERESSSINPEMFMNEKKYMMFVIERTQK